MGKKSSQFEREPARSHPVVRFVQSWEFMVPTTIGNISEADSYRIKVAAGLYQTYDKEDSESYIYKENHKPFKGDQIIKHCAEGKAFTTARERAKPRSSQIGGIVLASDASREQIQTVTNLETEAFTCCGNACLQHITLFQREGHLRIANSMPIVSVAVDKTTRKVRAVQIFSLAEQLAFTLGDVREVNGVGIDHVYEGITDDTWELTGLIAERRKDLANRMSEANFSRLVFGEAVAETRA